MNITIITNEPNIMHFISYFLLWHSKGTILFVFVAIVFVIFVDTIFSAYII